MSHTLPAQTNATSAPAPGRDASAGLSVLEASLQVALIRPRAGNLGSRLVKTPKAYFLHTGMLAHLLGFSDTPHEVRILARSRLLQAAR